MSKLFPDSVQERHPFWRGMKDFFWVALLTLLIWVYADMEFTDTMEFRATLVLSAGNDESIILQSDREIPLTFKLQGNRSSLEQFKFRLQRELGSRLAYDVSRYSPNEDSIPLPVAPMVEQSAAVVREGLTVVSASPTTTTIRLDRRILVQDVPVQPDFVEGELAEDHVPTIKPARVDLRVAQTEWKQFMRGRSENDPPELRTQPIDLSAVETGTVLQRQVPVQQSIEGVEIEPIPGAVTVEFKASKGLAQDERTVTVYWQVPPAWAEDETMQQYNFVRKDPLEWRRQITVKGPKQDLEQLQPGDIDAFIVLTDDDLKPIKSWLTREVQIVFPRGLKIQLVSEAPSVNFKLERIGTEGE
ncbi:MAG: hypothetical protein ACLFVU_07255 [Phycisphaerae bacterium]